MLRNNLPAGNPIAIDDPSSVAAHQMAERSIAASANIADFGGFNGVDDRWTENFDWCESRREAEIEAQLAEWEADSRRNAAAGVNSAA